MTTRTTDTRYPLLTALFLAGTTHYLCLMAFGYVGPLSTVEQVAAATLAGFHALGAVILMAGWWGQWRMRRRLRGREVITMTNYQWPVTTDDGSGGERVN